MPSTTDNSPEAAAGITLAQQHARAGRLAQAEAIYRDILSRHAQAVDALTGLADIAAAVGQADVALMLVERAAMVANDDAGLWDRLGGLRFGRGNIAGAAAAFARAMVIAPGSDAHAYHLGVACRTLGDPTGALKAFRRAGAAGPTHPFALSDQALLLRDAGRPHEARLLLQRALAYEPTRSGAWHNYGLVMADLARGADEEHAYRRATTATPGFTSPRYNWGCLAMARREYVKAIRQLRIVAALEPARAQAWNNLGCTLREQGLLTRALAAFRRGHASDPAEPSPPSNVIMTHAALDGPSDTAFARQWGASFPAFSRPRRPRPGQRLRIGYLSPDFRHHSCAYFLEPLFTGHDRGAVEVFAYADVPAPDATTARLKASVEHWRDLAGLGDQAVHQLITADDLDVLVDLAGHTGDNRLRVFAARAAPVQVGWLGYNATTGLRQIDWKLVDRWVRPDPADEWFAEGLWPLDRLAHCWRPPADSPDLAPRTAGAGRDGVVFGSFNALHKVGPATLATWARVLQAVPGSQLRLKGGAGGDPTARGRIVDAITAKGVAADRIVIDDWARETTSHLAAYNRIDIALDPFPYNGTTTTCEALWMGVPVVTLAGRRMLSRIGVSLLAAVGLEDLIARDEDEYVAIAAALAADHDRRRDLHGTLRDRMAASPLRDEAGFARAMEDAFLRMARGEQPPAV